jgi:hypothetical protein
VKPNRATDERDRLERFLEWERARNGDRGASGRRVLPYLTGMMLGVVAFALVAWLTGSSHPTPGRVASEPERAPAESVIPGDYSSPAVPPPAPRRTQGIEHPAPARAGTAREARALPPPPAPETRDQPSDDVAAAVAPAPRASAPVTRRSDAPAPPTPIAAAKPSVGIEGVVSDLRSEPVETVKRLVGYLPEVRLGKAIVRWVKSQPPAEPGARPAEAERLQVR